VCVHAETESMSSHKCACVQMHERSRNTCTYAYVHAHTSNTFACVHECVHACVCTQHFNRVKFHHMPVNNDSTLDYVPTSKDSITTKECVDINGWTLRDKYVLTHAPTHMPYM